MDGWRIMKENPTSAVEQIKSASHKCVKEHHREKNTPAGDEGFITTCTPSCYAFRTERPGYCLLETKLDGQMGTNLCQNDEMRTVWKKKKKTKLFPHHPIMEKVKYSGDIPSVNMQCDQMVWFVLAGLCFQFDTGRFHGQQALLTKSVFQKAIQCL